MNKDLNQFSRMPKSQLWAIYLRLRGAGDFWHPQFKWQLVEWLNWYYQGKPDVTETV